MDEQNEKPKSGDTRNLLHTQAQQINDLQNQLAEVTKILMKTANKKALQRFFSKKIEGKKVFISLFDDCVVTSWKLLSNEVKATANKGLDGIRENQLVRLFLDDGTKQGRQAELAYSDFVNDLTKVELDVDEVATDPKTGATYYKVTHKGTQYKFDIAFLN